MEVDPPWVHSPRAEGPGQVKVGGRARSPGEGRGGGGFFSSAPCRAAWVVVSTVLM